MCSNVLISIIIPTYNRASVLSQTIESVLAQTEQQFELIIVDDGSTDNTFEIVRQFQKKDSRIHFLSHEKNKGESAARNTGIQHAIGQYVAFIDSDDIWLSEKLSLQLALFKRGDESLGLVYTGAVFINQKKSEKRIKHCSVRGNIPEEEFRSNPIGSPSRVMLKKECFDTCGLFDVNFLTLEDWDMWIRITRHYTVEYVDLPLVRYYESDDSISINSEKLIAGYEALWKKYHMTDQPTYIRYRHYLGLGHRLCYYGSMREGKLYLKRAIKMDPVGGIAYVLLTLALMGNQVYRMITYRAMKHFQ